MEVAAGATCQTGHMRLTSMAITVWLPSASAKKNMKWATTGRRYRLSLVVAVRHNMMKIRAAPMLSANSGGRLITRFAAWLCRRAWLTSYNP